MGRSVRQDYMVLESDRAMAGPAALQVLKMFSFIMGLSLQLDLPVLESVVVMQRTLPSAQGQSGGGSPIKGGSVGTNNVSIGPSLRIGFLAH
jgi:hypothetical protein